MDTKQFAERLIKKHSSNNPFIIAGNLGIIILYQDLKNTLGFFNKYKRFKFIHINQNAPEKLQNFICAHELGHAVLHSNINTPFLKRHTLFSTDRVEREANSFAVELILPDKFIHEHAECGFYNIAKYAGIPDNLIILKS